jgi:hypothetical protein
MTSDTAALKSLQKPEFDQSLLSHHNNLLQKFRLTEDVQHQALCSEILKRYRLYLQALDFEKVSKGDLEHAVTAVEKYLNYAKEVERKYSRFNWRSDYAGSILPEFIYRILTTASQAEGIPTLFSTRDSIVEVSLSGNIGGGWEVRRKNQDLCVGLRKEKIVHEAREEIFLVPLIAIEVKTNIDINKLNGLDYSAERLKKTFPSARYILATETIDFSLKQNYASGYIDEIFALRKQLRSEARRNKATLKPEVFAQFQSEIMSILRKATLSQGHVYDRLAKGTLING